MKRISILLCVALALAAERAAHAADDSGELLAQLQHAYDRTLGAPGVRSMELAIHRGGRLVSRRAFDVAYRRSGEGSQSLLRFTEPSYLRGDALLVIDSGPGASDVWLYQAEERRPRRVGSTQHADAFYGSDLSFEELERPDFARWTLRGAREADPVCACDLVEARPDGDSQYGRLLVWIDRAHAAVARIDFFRGAEAEPAKRLTVTLDGARETAGHLHVTRLRIEQVGRDAWTDIGVVRMEIDPAIPAAVFSAAALEREGEDLYAVASRLADSGVAP